MKTLKIPFQIDNRGGLATEETTRGIIEQQITDILVTGDYHRRMNPKYGAGLPNFLFSPIIKPLLSAKAGEVQQVLAARVRLATIVSVTMEELSDSSSTVQLTVLYSILPSPTIFSMTQTITGLVTDETFAGDVL